MFWVAVAVSLSAVAGPNVQTPDAREFTERVTALNATVETLAAERAPLPNALAIEARQNVWVMGRLALSLQETAANEEIDNELMTVLLDVEIQLDSMLADPDTWDTEMASLVENTAQIRALSRSLLGGAPIERVASAD